MIWFHQILADFDLLRVLQQNAAKHVGRYTFSLNTCAFSA